jgi:hypothetical protein
MPLNSLITFQIRPTFFFFFWAGLLLLLSSPFNYTLIALFFILTLYFSHASSNYSLTLPLSPSPPHLPLLFTFHSFLSHTFLHSLSLSLFHARLLTSLSPLFFLSLPPSSPAASAPIFSLSLNPSSSAVKFSHFFQALPSNLFPLQLFVPLTVPAYAIHNLSSVINLYLGFLH